MYIKVGNKMKRLLLIVFSLTFILSGCGGEQLPNHGEVSHFTLLDGDGNDYHSDNGKVKLLTFFYTNCPDICPLTLFELTKIQEMLLEEGLMPDDVQIIAITLDAETDDVSTLSEYRNVYNPHKDGWKFLTGTDEQIKEITKDLKFFYAVAESGLVSHSTTMYLLDEKNNIRALHKMASMTGEKIDYEQIMNDIQQLVD
jgi:protein SCO1